MVVVVSGNSNDSRIKCKVIRQTTAAAVVAALLYVGWLVCWLFISPKTWSMIMFNFIYKQIVLQKKVLLMSERKREKWRE